MDRDPLYTLQIVKEKKKKRKEKKAYLPTLIFLVMLPQPDTFFGPKYIISILPLT